MSLDRRKIPDKSAAAVLLSKGQLKRICGQIGEGSRMAEAKEAQINKRKFLKEASKKMTDTWKNTFAGFHKQRLEKAKIKAYNIELERAHTDILEDKYRQARTKFVLNQQKRRVYFQTDRVKNLHAAKNLAEVVKEREAQKAIKLRAERAFKNYEDEYAKCILRDVKRYEEEIRQDVEQKKQMEVDNAAYLKMQFDAVKKKEHQEREEFYTMGRLIRDDAVRHEEEEKKKKLALKKQQNDFKLGLDHEIKLKDALGNAEQQMDEAENRRAKLFDDAKLNMKKLYKDRQNEIERLKEERKSLIAKNMSNAVEKLKLKEEKSLRRAIREKEKILEEETKEKEEAQLKAQQEIEKFYHAKIKAKKEEDFHKLEERLADVRQVIETEERLLKEEKKKVQKHKELEEEAQHVQLHQMDKRKKKEALVVRADMDEYTRHMKSLYNEEEIFQKYANMLIKECEEKGLNTFAMKKVARPGIECGKGPLFSERCIRPKYFSSVGNCAELQFVAPIVNNKSRRNTKARLGFSH